MITKLSGLVKFSSADASDASFVVIETHGVGYEVYVSSLTRAALPSLPGGAEVVTLLDVALADFFYSKALEVLVEAGTGKEVKKIKRKGRK